RRRLSPPKPPAGTHIDFESSRCNEWTESGNSLNGSALSLVERNAGCGRQFPVSAFVKSPQVRGREIRYLKTRPLPKMATCFRGLLRQRASKNRQWPTLTLTPHLSEHSRNRWAEFGPEHDCSALRGRRTQAEWGPLKRRKPALGLWSSSIYYVLQRVVACFALVQRM
ncbi:Protein of unknown function, partial [Gryllus bimaculatus]